eukprot:CAMPEP_0205878740 /NCGR_PEP_ID=MMETSP1083-20121108/15017_1 /ASSEMBLY_ACC=CAM_ASM_000430 /TAXON_ID=97485 /ORGANISM="Prymnesium parvum, Strain Texoma1" /LENGTH=74 /DNA_ID=CAMNT_0053241637 /DNA_START=83 /DNA_END=307 /DNA_ORIENTATION=-
MRSPHKTEKGKDLIDEYNSTGGCGVAELLPRVGRRPEEAERTAGSTWKHARYALTPTWKHARYALTSSSLTFEA